MKPGFLLLSLLLLAQQPRILSQTAGNELTINREEYLHSQNLDVLLFHNIYPTGMQGGIEIIHHNHRTATNGNVLFTRREHIEEIPGVNVSQEPIPPIQNPDRIIGGNTVSLPFDYEQIGLKYEIQVKPIEGCGFEVRVNFLEPVNTELVDDVSFEMEFFPELFAGKSYITENQSGIFPFQYMGTVFRGSTDIMASGKSIILAPEDEEIMIRISSSVNDIQLKDSRSATPVPSKTWV